MKFWDYAGIIGDKGSLSLTMAIKWVMHFPKGIDELDERENHGGSVAMALAVCSVMNGTGAISDFAQLAR